MSWEITPNETVQKMGATSGFILNITYYAAIPDELFALTSSSSN